MPLQSVTVIIPAVAQEEEKILDTEEAALEIEIIFIVINIVNNIVIEMWQIIAIGKEINTTILPQITNINIKIHQEQRVTESPSRNCKWTRHPQQVLQITTISILKYLILRVVQMVTNFSNITNNTLIVAKEQTTISKRLLNANNEDYEMMEIENGDSFLDQIGPNN
jgi:hypothetical protein